MNIYNVFGLKIQNEEFPEPYAQAIIIAEGEEQVRNLLIPVNGITCVLTFLGIEDIEIELIGIAKEPLEKFVPIMYLEDGCRIVLQAFVGE